MKKILILPVLFLFLHTSGQTHWTQSLRYRFQVQFKPADKSLEVQMDLGYVNHSPDTLSFIWLHVWPNAYRNDRTNYSEQLLDNGDTRFYFSSKPQKGYLNRLDFRVNGIRAAMEDHPEYLDVVKLLLPKILLPGDSISISTTFHLRLPYNFNGNGYSPSHFECKNWFPEPAVYDRKGWHPMPFLVQGGAYHEAADYQVLIESPSAYRIAAGAAPDSVHTEGKKTVYSFSMLNANSFAWIADNRFKWNTDSLILSTGRIVTLQYFWIPSKNDRTNALFTSVKKEINRISNLIGPYPYANLSIVQGTVMEDQQFSGLISLGWDPKKNTVPAELNKALIGQWFQTALLTDQRNDPWFSKGFLNYYADLPENNSPASKKFYDDDNLWLRVAEQEFTTQPISTASPAFTTGNDSLIPENKAGVWLRLLKDTVGMDRFNQTMKRFFSSWQFQHPYPSDFKKMMDSASRENLQPLFSKLDNRQSLFHTAEKRKLQPAFIFSAKNSGRNNYIGLSPIPGYNRYDGFMLGALIHNINLPANSFEFLFAPLYAFGSKNAEGLGRISYTWRPDTRISRITVGINGGQFATNKATDSLGHYLFENFSKGVPYIRIDFSRSGPRSSFHQWVDFKSYLIWEKNYAISSYAFSSKDSLNHPNRTAETFYYVNQLSYNLADERALYPYDLRVELQQSEMFYRINLRANYFLNYGDGGGLQVRWFAAKFGVWHSSDEVRVTRYEPKLTGVTGEEDYLYENYFVGRSASYAVDKPSVPNDGLPAQQIMNRDGGLKLRLDAYDYVQGRSSNWVSSLNFNTSLPAKLFPFPLPIRIFFDFGTYAEAWQNNPPTSRFLYTGGIQLSLFKNILNIYVPLIYSPDFKDVIGSTDFGKRITFSMDIQRIHEKSIIRKAAGL